MENPTFQFPVARFYTFSAFFLFADFISAFALWVIEIPSNDITASITDFSISTSVFELVCISFARCVILIVAYALLENMTVQAGQNGVNNKGKQIFWKMLSFITLLGSFVYITYKDIVVLKKYKNNKNIMQHNGYYALCISSFVFSILDILWYIRYLIYLRKLQNRYAVLNDKESGSKDGTKEKKNVNVKRLMSLAKPVSASFFELERFVKYCVLVTTSETVYNKLIYRYVVRHTSWQYQHKQLDQQSEKTRKVKEFQGK